MCRPYPQHLNSLIENILVGMYWHCTGMEWREGGRKRGREGISALVWYGLGWDGMCNRFPQGLLYLHSPFVLPYPTKPKQYTGHHQGMGRQQKRGGVQKPKCHIHCCIWCPLPHGTTTTTSCCILG